MPATFTRRLGTLTDAADALAVSTRAVRRDSSGGQLEALRLGRKALWIKGGICGAVHRREASRSRSLRLRPAVHREGGAGASELAAEGRRAQPGCAWPCSRHEDGSTQTWPLLVPCMLPKSDRDPRKGL